MFVKQIRFIYMVIYKYMYIMLLNYIYASYIIICKSFTFHPCLVNCAHIFPCFVHVHPSVKDPNWQLFFSEQKSPICTGLGANYPNYRYLFPTKQSTLWFGIGDFAPQQKHLWILHVLVLLSESWKSPVHILKLILFNPAKKKHLEGLILSELRLLKWEARRFKETLALFMASNVNTIICPLGCDYRVEVPKTENKTQEKLSFRMPPPKKYI